MNTFERLAEADTELAFFVILCDLFNGTFEKNAHAELHSRHDQQRGFFVDISIRQVIRGVDEYGQRAAYMEVTNTFTLYEDGTLIWTIRNQPPIVGLKPIQAYLRWLQETLETEALRASS